MKKIRRTTGLLLALALLLGCGITATAASDRAERVAELVAALPTAAEVQAMGQQAQQEAYEATQAAYDAYQALDRAEKAGIPSAEAAFEALFGYFNSLVMPLEQELPAEENPDTGPGSLISYWAHWLVGLFA